MYVGNSSPMLKASPCQQRCNKIQKLNNILCKLRLWFLTAQRIAAETIEQEFSTYLVLLNGI